MDKVLTGIIIALFLAIVGMGIYIKYENKTNRDTRASLVQANKELLQMQSSLKVQATIHDATEEVVTQAVKKTSELTQKTAIINQKVDKTHVGVVDEKISNDLANTAYLDSMWDAYCEAASASPNCSSRQPSH